MYECCHVRGLTSYSTLAGAKRELKKWQGNQRAEASELEPPAEQEEEGESPVAEPDPLVAEAKAMNDMDEEALKRCRCRCQIEPSAFFLPHTIVYPIPYDRSAHPKRSSSPS